MRTRSYASLKIFITTLALCAFSQTSFAGGDNYDYERYLRADTDGVFWHSAKGNPFRTASKMGLNGDGLVILVGASKEYQDQAIVHAHKLAGWFEDHPQTPSVVPIVVYELSQKGVTFAYFLAHGLTYKHDEYAPEGFIKPEYTSTVLSDAVVSHVASIVIRQRRIVNKDR